MMGVRQTRTEQKRVGIIRQPQNSTARVDISFGGMGHKNLKKNYRFINRAR